MPKTKNPHGLPRTILAIGRLLSSGQVSRTVGARIAGLDRLAFDEALFQRNIASHTPDMLAEGFRLGDDLPSEPGCGTLCA